MSRIEENVRRIALKHLDLLTLKRRYRDDLDFHDLAVWEIRTLSRKPTRPGLNVRRANGRSPENSKP
jgi:hypothetical protein